MTQDVKVVRKRLADGTIKEYRYARKTGGASPRSAVGSIGHVVRLYYGSPEWAGFSKSTQCNRVLYLKELERIADRPIRELRRREIIAFRDVIARTRGSGAANQFIQSTSALLTWALQREWIDANTAARVGMLKYTPLPAWTKEMVEDAMVRLPPYLARVVLLALFTGQRRSDLCSIRWSDIRDGVIHLTQQKTGTPLRIPVHPALSDAMNMWPRTSIYVLTGVRGGQMTTYNLTRSMNAMQEAGRLPKGFNVHGLRKLAAAMLAEAGCSTHEIASITGHKTLKMVEHYTRSVNQERLAETAVSKLETGLWKLSETDI